MNILPLCGVGLLSVIICVVLKSMNREAAVFAGIASGIIMFSMTVSMLTPTINAVKALSNQAGIDPEVVGIMLKALAVCYITTLCSGIARDAGESSAAVKLELGGRAAIAAISLPVFANLVSIITEIVR